MAEHQYFQDCLQGLAYTEDVLRSYCQKVIGELHTKTKLDFRAVLACTVATEQDNIEKNGWPASVLGHKCRRSPICNESIIYFLEHLPCGSKLNRTEVLKAICQPDAFEFAKLFAEPWMCELGSFGEMDAHCFFVLLDNVSFFHHGRSQRRQALYQQHIGKMRKLAQSFVYEDVKDLTKADRDMCLQAIINALAFVYEHDADEVIHTIHELRYTNTRDTHMISQTLDRCNSMKRKIIAVQQEVIRAVSDILHKDDKHDSSEDEDELEGKISHGKHKLNGEDYEDLIQFLIIKGLFLFLLELFNPKTVRSRGQYHYQLVKSIVDSSVNFRIEELFNQQIMESLPASPDGATNVSSLKYKYAQAVVYYLENAKVAKDEVCSLLNALMSPDSTCDTTKDTHIATLTNAVQRQEHASLFQDIVYSETNATYFNVCYQIMFTMENGLRQHCKSKMEMIHNAITEQFPRKCLCQLADKDDLVRVNDSPSAELIFKHECKKEPECNTFLKAVFSQRSAKCILTPQTMFRNVNPQDCIDNRWELAKLFLEPCMHMFNGFDDLDAFCLLTMLGNIQMFDGSQSEADAFLRAVFKARQGALKVLQSSKQELTKQTMDSFFESVLVILERRMFPGSDRLIKQIKDLTNGTPLPVFDIRLAIESKRQTCVKQFYDKSIIRDENECNWFRNVLALKSLQRSLVPIVQKTMTELHKDSENTFGRKLCSEANADDIERKFGRRHVIFRHKCIGISSPPCNSLLNIITKLTATSADLFSMLRGTDPQTWLRSPFDLASIFLKDWMRHDVRKFEECDVGALFCLIKQCQLLRQKFNVKEGEEDVMMPVRGVRNRLLHSSSMETSKQKMEDDIDVLLNMLRHIEHEQVGSEVTEAIEDIVQIKNDELNLLHHEGIQLLQEAMADLKRKQIQQEDLINKLRQNIVKLETVLGNPFTSNADKISDGAATAEGTESERNTSKGFLFWCRCALALKYLQLTWMPVVEKEMNDLHSKILHKHLGRLCKAAKSEDIARATNGRLTFKHTCTNNCNTILDVIQNLFPDSVDKLAMLQDTDPKNWLSSPLELARLFMKKWMRSGIEQFRHCDTSALCQITKHCQSLMKTMDETLVIDVRSVRNTTVHSPTMELSQQKMEDNIDVVLTFIRHLNRNSRHVDFAEADANINMLKNADFTLLRGDPRRLLQEFVSDMKRDVGLKQVETDKLSKKLTKMEKTVNNIISEGSLPGKQFTDNAAKGVSEGWNTGMDGYFDRSPVVDQDERKKKRREAFRQLKQEKENIQGSTEDLKKKTEEQVRHIIEIERAIESLTTTKASVENASGMTPVYAAIGGIIGGLAGGVAGIFLGPAGVVAGAAEGAAFGASIGAVTLTTAGVAGTFDTNQSTVAMLRGHIEKLKATGRERRQEKHELERKLKHQRRIQDQFLHVLNSDGAL